MVCTNLDQNIRNWSTKDKQKKGSLWNLMGVDEKCEVKRQKRDGLCELWGISTGAFLVFEEKIERILGKYLTISEFFRECLKKILEFQEILKTVKSSTRYFKIFLEKFLR